MGVNMNTVNAYSSYQSSYSNTVKDKQKAEPAKKADKAELPVTIGQKYLSPAAQKLLERIRSERSDMDIMVADFDKGDDAQEILSRGTKEFSVLFSSEELEKMAADEDYYNEKMKSLDGAVRMSDEINAKYGFERMFGKDGVEVTKFGISFNSDGTTSFFAELEKSSAKQKERIEAAREERAEERKEAAQETKAKEAETKTITVKAATEEELIQKMQEIDWDKVPVNTQTEGTKFDFSI